MIVDDPLGETKHYAYAILFLNQLAFLRKQILRF